MESTTIANSGSGFFRFALITLDTFNGDITLTNTGSSTIRMADNVPGTVFNGNIIVNSTFGGGIYFSESGGGTATLASGRTISVGGLGFSLGELRLRRFTQNGGTPQNLVFTGTAGIVLGPSIILMVLLIFERLKYLLIVVLTTAQPLLKKLVQLIIVEREAAHSMLQQLSAIAVQVSCAPMVT
jgi:hypothetical protein